MMRGEFFRRACLEVLRAALICAALCLAGEALFAVFIRAFAPSYAVIAGVNAAIECACAFAACALSVRRERALFKGLAAGTLCVICDTLVFGMIGGAIALTAFFALKLLLGAVAGGLGALLGASLARE